MYHEVKGSSNLYLLAMWLPLAPSIVKRGRMELIQNVIQPTQRKVGDALLWDNFRTGLDIANYVQDPRSVL